MATPQNSYTSLAPWFGWLRRLLTWQIAVTRYTYGPLADEPHRGLFIPDLEADLLAAGPEELPDDLRRHRDALAEEREQLATADTALARLGRRFGLDPFSQDVLLLALAPALDLRFERLYAYIQDDTARKRPTVDLALRLFCRGPEERLDAMAAFAEEGPLLRHRLIHLFDEGLTAPNLVAYGLKLDARIVGALLGHPALDSAIAPFVRLTHPERSTAELIMPEALLTQARRILDAPGPGPVIAVEGGYGSGRRALAEALCAERGLPLLVIDGARLRASELSPAEAIGRCVREALLAGAALLWQGADALLDGETGRAWRDALLVTLDQHPGPAFLALTQPLLGQQALRSARLGALRLPVPTITERVQLWRRRIGETHGFGEQELQALAGAFRLTGGQIRDAARVAGERAAQQGQALSLPGLYAACRGLADDAITRVARRVPLTYGWDDLVLPADQIERLREICVQVRYRRVVLEGWGFDRHLAMGKGLNLLFAGESGTGKTMAAEVIAAELGLDLYKIDLSGVISKYIGETEKNLDRVFAAAREANAILFFDEADAMFGKRSAVHDSHDRYANIEVAYLLQSIEAYDGVVILATNMRSNIDSAFIRRLHMVIDFPMPKETERLRIWYKVFPPCAPLSPDVDLAALARNFDLAGGNIRNVALLAAYMAAERGAPIGRPELIHAIRREYQKIGRMPSNTELLQHHRATEAAGQGR